MLKTIAQDGQIIGATFQSHADAELAVQALQEVGVSPIDIQMVVQLNAHSQKNLYMEILIDRGFTSELASYCDDLIRRGRTLIAVYKVSDQDAVIDLLETFQADFIPEK